VALSLRKNSDRGTVGLDIDGRFLAAVRAESGRVASAASADLPDGLVTDGEVADPSGLAGALRRFVADAGLPRNVRLGVANQHIVVRQVELPQIGGGAEREAAVRFQAAEAIAMPLDEAILDHQVIGDDPSEEGASRQQVVVVAARRSMVEGLVKAVKGAGLRPEGVDLDAFALVRMLADGPGGEDTARVFCHLAGVTNLAIAVGDSCSFTRPLSMPWDGDDAAATLADEIQLSIDYYMAQPNARPVGELVLSGPGSSDEGLVAGLGGQLGVETRVARPLGRLDAGAVAPDDDPCRYTVAAGLALGAAA
jgi:type IV pilus assembly protein PilM